MNSAIQRLQNAQIQRNMAAVAQLLTLLVQEQHPTLLLSPTEQRQFGCCCAHLAVAAGPTGPAKGLLLAAETCFNYAQQLPENPALRCPYHNHATA